MASLELDYMEYSSDATAQAAYISNGIADTTMTVAYDSGELAAAATSVTISGLDGDVDEDYELICRLVGDAAAASPYLGITFNNDTGGNYGRQDVLGADATALAARGTTDTLFPLAAYYRTPEDQILFSVTKIKAKSGFVRTMINKFANQISGTTVTYAGLAGGSWNNTADNIASIEIKKADADGTGIKAGSRIILLKKSSAATTKTWEQVYTHTIALPEIIATAYPADIDDEDMADITDWTDSDSGAGESTQVTFDGKSCMKLNAPTGYAYRYQDIGTFSNRTVFTINLYIDSVGAGTANAFTLDIYSATERAICCFASDGLFVYNTTAYGEVGTNLVTQDTWQEWCFDVNWVTKTMDVYIGEVLQVANQPFSSAGTYTNGTVNFFADGRSAGNCLAYIDSFKAGNPGTTSLTISGLTGNTDVLYRISANRISTSGTGDYLGLQFNSDTAANYGYQDLYGIDTTVTADPRGAFTSIGLEFVKSTTTGNSSKNEVLVYVKSGFVRTAIVESTENIAGTSVGGIGIMGNTWSNTADEITTARIFGTMGIGSEITVERLNL